MLPVVTISTEMNTRNCVVSVLHIAARTDSHCSHPSEQPNTESFDHVNDWLKEVNRYAAEGTVKLLVGNKSDRTADKVVSESQAKEFADELGIPFIETSAKSSKNVEEAFLTMAGELIRQRDSNGGGNENNGIDLNGDKKGNSNCC